MEEEIEILKEDLKNNINDFKVNYLNKITFDNFTKFWPTLLNPSPSISDSLLRYIILSL